MTLCGKEKVGEFNIDIFFDTMVKGQAISRTVFVPDGAMFDRRRASDHPGGHKSDFIRVLCQGKAWTERKEQHEKERRDGPHITDLRFHVPIVFRLLLKCNRILD